MKISRYKNYRFNFHFGNYKIVISGNVRENFIHSPKDVRIDLWWHGELLEEPCTLEDFNKSKIGKALQLKSFESLYRAVISSIFTNGVIEYIISNTEPSIHTPIDFKDYL